MTFDALPMRIMVDFLPVRQFISFITVMFHLGYLISLTHLCFIAFLSMFVVLIDVLIYSAAQLQQCVINLLTYLSNYVGRSG